MVDKPIPSESVSKSRSQQCIHLDLKLKHGIFRTVADFEVETKVFVQPDYTFIIPMFYCIIVV